MLHQRMTHIPGLFARSQPNYMSGGREFHAYLMTDRGLTRGNYIGPGTNVLERIRRGDAPISGTDKVAQAHDLRYTLANGDKAAERAADHKMISKLQDPKVDSMLNRAIGRVPIQAKVAAERMGIMQQGNFSKGPAINPEEKAMVETKLNELEMEGFGFGKPGARLRTLIRQKGGAGGNLPPLPRDLPIGITPESIAQIRNIAMALNVPGRADEWIHKQNIAAYYEYMGVPSDQAVQAAFGTEEPWNGLIDQGQATRMEQPFGSYRDTAPMEEDEEDLDGYYKDYHHPVKAPRKRPGKSISKQAFLERMAEGRRKAAAKRKRGTTKKKPTRKRLTPTKRRVLTKRARQMFKRMGRGLGLAGEGLKLAGEGFELPDSVDDYSGLAKSVADHAQKHFRISVPAEMVGSLGEEMSGMGADWKSLESRLSGLRSL